MAGGKTAGVSGVYTERRIQYKRAVSPTPGQFVADSVSSAIQDRFFEILKMDGTPIGTIMVTGMGGAVPAPGTPSVIADGNFTIIGNHLTGASGPISYLLPAPGRARIPRRLLTRRAGTFLEKSRPGD